MMFAGAKRTNKGLLALVATAGALCAVFCILPSYRNQKSVLLSGRAGAVESMKKSARQLEKEGFVDQARALMKEASQLEKVKKAERYPQRSSYNQQSRLAAQNFPSGRRGGGFTPSKVWTYAPNWLPMHSGFQFSQRRQVMRPSFARPAMAWSSLEEGPAEEVIEEPVPRAVVASGLPPAHDGAWGSSFKKNAGGNEEAMRKAGINYDDYPLDVYRSIPYMTFDPTVGTEKEFKAKIPASKEVVSPYTLKHGRNKGGDVMPAGWGVWNEGGVGEDRLRAQGVHVDRWPMDFYAGFPNPAWDGTEFDQARRIPKAPVKDAKAAVERHRESQKRIESAGVKSNGIPWEPETTKRNYNSVDGMMDTLVPYEQTPQFRQGGIAPQERPAHFLLDEDPNGAADTQASAINKLFQSGDLDARPQPKVDLEDGIEMDPENPVSFS